MRAEQSALEQGEHQRETPPAGAKLEMLIQLWQREVLVLEPQPGELSPARLLCLCPCLERQRKRDSQHHFQTRAGRDRGTELRHGLCGSLQRVRGHSGFEVTQVPSQMVARRHWHEVCLDLRRQKPFLDYSHDSHSSWAARRLRPDSCAERSNWMCDGQR